MRERKNVRGIGAALCFIAAVLSLIAGVLPAVRGSRVNAAFLGVGVTLFAVGIAVSRKKRGLGASDGEPPA